MSPSLGVERINSSNYDVGKVMTNPWQQALQMNSAHETREFDDVCRAFELGEQIANAQRISGGRRHLVLKVETAIGNFALKILNDGLIQDDGSDALFELSERVAQLFADNGIPSVSALKRNGKCFHRVNDKSALAYNWVDGTVHKVGTVNEACAAQMGKTLGKMHALNMQEPSFRQIVSLFDANLWTKFIEQITRLSLPLADVLHENASNIHAWAAEANSALPLLQANTVLSHGDLDQQNIIWSDEWAPSIIDWESASLQNPAVELLNLCLDWSGFPNGTPDKECFIVCYREYLESNENKTVLGSLDLAVKGELAYFLGWLSFSLSRCNENSSDAELQIASDEAMNALRSIHLFMESKDRLLSWIR